MKYYLGIDGGGTKTKVTIIDESENIIFENTTGPSSIDTVNRETTLAHIKEAIQPFVESHNQEAFSGIFAGLGGIVFDQDCKMVETLLKKLPLVNDQTFIMAQNDMYNALYSSNQFDQAMTLICGTGMVAFGKNGQHTHKAGGWGYAEGELGSAYHLGREAIRHCIRAYDHRLEKTEFEIEIAKTIHLSKATDIMNVMREYHDERTKTARLAPIVTKYANLGNKDAKSICDFATDELALAIKAVYRTLEFDDVTLVIVGSLGNSEGYFRDKLIEKINAISSKIKITSPLIDPAFAAAKAAIFFKGVQI